MDVTNIGSLTKTSAAIQGATIARESGVFQNMLNAAKSVATGGQVVEAGKLPGDWTSGFTGTYTALADKTAKPVGAAARRVDATIDRTSPLYEKSLELESYMVKIMLTSMRASVQKSSLYGEDNAFARTMYEDMMYDELAVSMTKTAGFGLADQIYLELNSKGKGGSLPPAPTLR
jgi:flagellar protein FlgJ